MPHGRWNLLFLFLPSGSLDQHQREMLKRLGTGEGRLLVVYAAPNPRDVPVELTDADALVWKDLRGFDFSAYTLGLTLIARHSPGATTYVQNDSVFGPFASVDDLVAAARWDLTGFIASAAVENHLSSFAFIIKAVTTERLAMMRSVLSTRWCHDDFDSVLLMQETRIARIADQTMSVGSFFYLPARPASADWTRRIATRIRPARVARYPLDVRGDATLGSPFQLLERGFPFLKRSLLGKFEGVADVDAVRAYLRSLHWPVD